MVVANSSAAGQSSGDLGALGGARNLFETALEAAHLARPCEYVTDDGRQHVLTPDGYSLSTLKDESILPSHASARIIVDDRASFSAIVARFRQPETILIGDIDKGVITALIDWHAPPLVQGEACLSGARRHQIELHLRESEEFKRWDAIEGELCSQADFARFLEENGADVLEPDGADLLELARDMEAASGAKFAGKVNLQNGDRTFKFESTTQTPETIRIPQKFVLSIPIYVGEEPLRLTALFRYRVAGGGLAFGFQWHRVDHQRLALFASIVAAASEGCGCPSYLGRVAE